MIFKEGGIFRHVGFTDVDMYVADIKDVPESGVIHLVVHYINRLHTGVFATGDKITVKVKDLHLWSQVA